MLEWIDWPPDLGSMAEARPATTALAEGQLRRRDTSTLALSDLADVTDLVGVAAPENGVGASETDRLRSRSSADGQKLRSH